jgi:hypothetical protein
MGMKTQKVPVNEISQGSDNEKGEGQHQSPHMNANIGIKKPVQELNRGPEENMQAGSDEGSQNGSQGHPQHQQQQMPPHMYDYAQYGLQQHSPYQYSSYNYQMPPPPNLGGQGYGMYPPGYSPMMNQRPAMKQYAYAPYNYQERAYGPAIGMKGMQPPPEYYEEYKYGGDAEMPGMRGGRHESQPGYPPTRAPKGQKPHMSDRPLAQYPGYQYTNQHMSPMYQPVHHPVHYDVRSPYDYAPYKAKAGDVGMPPVQPPAYYNYSKPIGIPPYSYTGGQYAKNVEQDDEEGALRKQQMYREDQLATGAKNKKALVKQPKTGEDSAAKDQKSTKVGKGKQFAEDFEANNMDN